MLTLIPSSSAMRACAASSCADSADTAAPPAGLCFSPGARAAFGLNFCAVAASAPCGKFARLPPPEARFAERTLPAPARAPLVSPARDAAALRGASDSSAGGPCRAGSVAYAATRSAPRPFARLASGSYGCPA
jgi:hypothetical protein